MSATPSDRPTADPEFANGTRAPEAQHRGRMLTRSVLITWATVFLLGLVFLIVIIAFVVD